MGTESCKERAFIVESAIKKQSCNERALESLESKLGRYPQKSLVTCEYD